MSTRFTKSEINKPRTKNRGPVVTGQPRPDPAVAATDGISPKAWWIGVIVIMAIGTVLRLYDLNLVPLHHDEGVNGNFLVRLVREGVYQYDPQNYHGPTLYYFAALIPALTKLLFGADARENYGLTTFTIRLVPALFGLATIGLVLLLRRRLGAIATLAAGLMLAVSPGAVYLSRYFIHETLFVFFTLGIVVAAVWFYDERNPAYLIPAAACAALLFATKETAMISVGVLIIALFMTLGYMRLNAGTVRTPGGKRKQSPTGFSEVLHQFDASGLLFGIGMAVVVFLGLYLLLYSSFFTNNKGISDSLQTFAIWTKTGTVAHVHPPTTYLTWLISQESPLLLLGVVGAAFVVLKPKNATALFCALWSFGLIAAYSLIPYKTPWLMLNFIVPLALIAGYVVQELYELSRADWRLASMVLLLAIGVAVYQSIDLNFINYDNDDQKYVYVYAHTRRGLLDLVNQVEQIARERSGDETGITIVSPDYWPLPWYFRNFNRVGYFSGMAASSEPMIIANVSQKQQMEANFGGSYRLVPSKENDGAFELRPGVRLLLYLRRS